MSLLSFLPRGQALWWFKTPTLPFTEEQFCAEKRGIKRAGRPTLNNHLKSWGAAHVCCSQEKI